MQVAVVSYCLPVVAVGGIAIVILGGAKQPGRPVGDGDLPRRARRVLHDGRRRAARLQGRRQGQPRRRARSTAAAAVHAAAQGAPDRRAPVDPERPADRRADRVPRRGARRVHGRDRPQRRHHADPAAGRPRLGAGVGGVPAVRGRRAGRVRRASGWSPGWSRRGSPGGRSHDAHVADRATSPARLPPRARPRDVRPRPSAARC